MVIVIDAYNFIKQNSKIDFVSEQILNYWLSLFQKYMKVRSNRIVLVFDAGPSLFASHFFHENIEIFYSGQKQTADDIIKKWLEKNKMLDIFLVTSDREIRDFAATLNIASVNSLDFYKAFHKTMQEEERLQNKISKTIYKMSDFESDDLDNLMEESTRYLMHEDLKRDDARMIRIRNGKKIAKQDKKILKKLEKV
ncbi:NYN domain-containing protein [Candidatus Dependentiae bacterium]|nr:NYN domain-containing protein [Candidatus Dependentiae bacterium]